VKLVAVVNDIATTVMELKTLSLLSPLHKTPIDLTNVRPASLALTEQDKQMQILLDELELKVEELEGKATYNHNKYGLVAKELRQ
jgi:hypothetical protein